MLRLGLGNLGFGLGFRLGLGFGLGLGSELADTHWCFYLNW